MAMLMNMNIDSVKTSVIFTKGECENIIKRASLMPIGEAEYFAKSRNKSSDVRSTKAIELIDDALGSHIFSSMKKMNSLQFEISGYESLQLLKYEVGDHYTWHTDWSPVNNKRRKLSMTVQLSEPTDYEGGDVEILDGPEIRILSREVGSATVFPSWAAHRVTPITAGIRWALVAWAMGKPFK